MNVMTPRPQIADERVCHAHALQLLHEVREYLLRLPVVPATRDLAGKIDAFVADPGAAVARDRAKEQRRFDEAWSASLYAPDGAAALEAQVCGSTLTLVGTAIEPIATGQVQRRGLWGIRRDAPMPAIRLELRQGIGAIFDVVPPPGGPDVG